ncbi:unnamed protein product [Rotaria sp. Silwood2]|nr:unnamed protein product [Rotaria sp. Silwood2]CAF4319805.1 unnamed protein product [Rotaria sp. Silwood2]
MKAFIAKYVSATNNTTTADNTSTTATTSITTTSVTSTSTTLTTTTTVTATTTSTTTTTLTTTTTSITTTSFTTTTTCSPIFASSLGLVAYFALDSSPSYLTDVNATLTATAASVTNVPGERNQCLSFTGTMNSYFQVSNLVSLGSSTTPFSIALYISPNVLSGTLVHISKYQNAIQIWGGSTAKYVLGPIPPLNSWTHVVQTWSPTNGLTLYINGALYAQGSTFLTYGASGVSNYLTLASTLQAIPYPANGCSTTGVLGGAAFDASSTGASVGNYYRIKCNVEKVSS